MNEPLDNRPAADPGNQWQRAPDPGREPALNLPWAITVLVLLMIVVHAVREYLLTPEQDFLIILKFSFIPAYFTSPLDQVPYPMARYWSAVSYAFLHGDWSHVMVNLLWMVAFGSAVAKRLGTSRFLLLTLFSAVAGAAAHFMVHPQDITPVIGASACVSAYMGAACRFVMGASALRISSAGAGDYHPPALGLVEALTNRNVIIFIGIWLALNFLFGTGLVPIAGADTQIAWEAHVGGFVFGLLAFSLFDRAPGKQ